MQLSLFDSVEENATPRPKKQLPGCCKGLIWTPVYVTILLLYVMNRWNLIAHL
jgi:hypothetical protein